MKSLPVREIRWQKSYRIIPSRYPPIQLFERIAPPEDWEEICELEGLTNPRIREEAGNISLVPPKERVSGNGASYIMAAFTHMNPQGTRFSDGTYGVYYVAHTMETAHRETISRMERFYEATAEDRMANDFRALVGSIRSTFHDIRGGDKRWKTYHSPDDWTESHKLARGLRDAGSNGIAYDSVRHAGGECIAAFRPKAVAIPCQAGHFRYKWDGRRICQYYDFEKDRWVDVAHTC